MSSSHRSTVPFQLIILKIGCNSSRGTLSRHFRIVTMTIAGCVLRHPCKAGTQNKGKWLSLKNKTSRKPSRQNTANSPSKGDNNLLFRQFIFRQIWVIMAQQHRFRLMQVACSHVGTVTRAFYSPRTKESNQSIFLSNKLMEMLGRGGTSKQGHFCCKFVILSSDIHRFGIKES